MAEIFSDFGWRREGEQRRRTNLYFLNPALIFQLTLIRAGWNELLIAGFSFRSINHPSEGILWGRGHVISRDHAHMQGVGDIYDRIDVELIGKMRELNIVRLL